MISDNMQILKDEYGFDTIEVRKECLRIVEPLKGNRVLDIGTGSGWMAILLAQEEYDVTTIDVDEEAIERAKQRAYDAGEAVMRHINFIHADALRIPFPDNTFDAVFSFDSMHHMPDCSKALGEMIRVAKDGAHFMIADLNAKGLEVVREVVSRDGETHYENECRINIIAQFIEETFSNVERIELEWVTVFVATIDKWKGKIEMTAPEDILRNKKSYAIVGASQNKTKYSYELFCTLRDAGYTVYPINPRYENIDDVQCYPSLESLTAKPEVVIIAMDPQNTEKIIDQLRDSGIDIVWMPPGCWSESAVDKCKSHGVKYLYDVCPIGTLFIMNDKHI